MKNKRLVEKGPSDGYYEDYYVGSYGNICNLGDNKCTSMVHNKLGQLEDIEEELGIDLITLFTNKEFYCRHSNEIIKRDCLGILLPTKQIMLGDLWSFTSYDLTDYGKTWALTKEELEE